ncbi:DUF262 domain-containing protein [Nocardioides dongxiaopingii]|uniref:DUF262 domain-containing protein n=1 Tax=Nocardioides sp. S-1144 TaxID=2582905 RepID=UPI00110F0820|nr:DUF262 domain-containing protein [Nocardioides sp. S-1144]QCW51032.1 DUF262 domain-containing protein [Nocardioides sp. S-1144]
MTIRANGVTAIQVGELMQQALRIPHYQRPYSWEPPTALQLLDDVREAFGAQKHRTGSYVLGAVILHSNNGGLDVVDGQQRLLTLRMILSNLNPATHLPLPTDTDSPVTRVLKALERRISSWSDDDRSDLLDFIRYRCEVVRIVTNDVDEAFRVFDSQNYRGMPLAPHDLLKAHHLREMRGEGDAAMIAVVEDWESVPADELNRLFSVYLFRVARWAQGNSAPAFSVRDIGMFKGLSPTSASSPNSKYHLAAQAAIPILQSWRQESSPASQRQAGRIRFQLDAPVTAGRPFFEMVTFMREELTRLRRESFPTQLEPYASSHPTTLDELPGRSRYRYVAELYLAAVLYYTNKFGDEDLDAARDRLFAWAYSLRVSMLRVQFRSIDNQGRGDSRPSAFTLMRNASNGRVVYQLPTVSSAYSEGHESGLTDLLKQLGA